MAYDDETLYWSIDCLERDREDLRASDPRCFGDWINIDGCHGYRAASILPVFCVFRGGDKFYQS
ncbi:MAG: hypothetical protein CME21_13150 [Gemmatimonadetes bacterium]|nr:hypothetical protein [Gemmatimonadota bacterium]